MMIRDRIEYEYSKSIACPYMNFSTSKLKLLITIRDRKEYEYSKRNVSPYMNFSSGTLKSVRMISGGIIHD